MVTFRNTIPGNQVYRVVTGWLSEIKFRMRGGFAIPHNNHQENYESYFPDDIYVAKTNCHYHYHYRSLFSRKAEKITLYYL